MTNKIRVTINVIIHATENIEKLYKMFEGKFGVKEESYFIQNLTGHHDNPITILNIQLMKKDASNFIEKFIEGISFNDLNDIKNDLDELILRSGISLRLDKQEFVKGHLALEEKDSINVKIYTPVYNKKEAVKTYLALLKKSN